MFTKKNKKELAIQIFEKKEKDFTFFSHELTCMSLWEEREKGINHNEGLRLILDLMKRTFSIESLRDFKYEIIQFTTKY